ncbi:MAG TPA: hypothetical protein VMU95_04280 [Trebonia sp.]|nr:hypothetical protein [Trebonia sp.]
MTAFSKHVALGRHTVRVLAVAFMTAGAAGSIGALAVSSTNAAAATSVPRARPASLTVKQIALGARLHHDYQVNGKGAWHAEALSSPDDITFLGRDIFVTFQDGVGPQGQASPDGNLVSTIVEFTLAGREVRQWDVTGKVDGLTANPLTWQVIATANEDANSSLYTIAYFGGTVVHYAYSKSPLPHNGGTDAISVFHGQILISASAPGTVGAAAPQPAYPAVYVVRLNARSKVATVDPLFYDEATARAVNGPQAGHEVQLALTDPDSNEVVPAASPEFTGDFLLTSQGDEEQVYDHVTRHGQRLSVLSLTVSVDDTSWATTPHGAIYVTDNSGDTVDTVTGTFAVGTTYTSVTPCDENSAPATCPAPGFPANYLGTINLKTGVITPVALDGPSLQPQGEIFLPSPHQAR